MPPTSLPVRAPARSGRVLAAVVLVAGAGCGHRAGGHAAQTVTTAGADRAAVVQVLTFQAYDDTGLLPNLVRASTVDGSCAGGSTLRPGRADAWRCEAGDIVLDPCFANPTGTELACLPDPFTTQATIVRLAAPLGRAGSNRNDPGQPPWFLELADGSRCGRTPPSGYRCDAGRSVGEPDVSRPVWRVRTLDAEGATIDVRTAWY